MILALSILVGITTSVILFCAHFHQVGCAGLQWGSGPGRLWVGGWGRLPEDLWPAQHAPTCLLGEAARAGPCRPLQPACLPLVLAPAAASQTATTTTTPLAD